MLTTLIISPWSLHAVYGVSICLNSAAPRIEAAVWLSIQLNSTITRMCRNVAYPRMEPLFNRMTSRCSTGWHIFVWGHQPNLTCLALEASIDEHVSFSGLPNTTRYHPEREKMTGGSVICCL